MTYTAKTRPETTKTRRMLKTTEVKILRKIAGKIMLDGEQNEKIRRTLRDTGCESVATG